MDREATSRDVAKERLRQVLVHDRARLAPELMAELKQVLVNAAKDYVEIEPEGVALQLELKADSSILVLKMPVKSIVRERET